MRKEMSMDTHHESESDRLEARTERVVLIGLIQGQTAAELEESERSLAELAELAEAAGARVVGRMSQRRTSPDPAYLVGKGKIEALRDACLALEADTVVFDDELTGSQIRNIEQATACKVIDRTFLILDIFARRARSHEGKLQVELAQLQYRLSRLTGLGHALSRLGGGIGTRGPGETKLENDRRHINRRIQYLRIALTEIASRRSRTRRRRHEREMLTFAVVGYTNAGKSTLINALCASDLLTADQVFATLDPSVRRLPLTDGSTLLLVDTVGLIRRLPHHLIDAFHATLEEVADADAILEVIDASAPDAATRMAVVEQLLDQLGAASQPRFFVFNKMDLLAAQPAAADPDQVDQEPTGLVPELALAMAGSKGRQSFLISAVTGQGLDTLKQALADFAAASMLSVVLLLPYAEAGLIDYIRRFGRLDEIAYLPEGIQTSIHIRYSHFHPLSPFVLLAEKPEER
jgi:GTPase